MEPFGWVAMWLAKTEGSLIKEKGEKACRGRQLICRLCLRAYQLIQVVTKRKERKCRIYETFSDVVTGLDNCLEMA